MVELKAKEHCCEECAILPPGISFYAPCNQPAVAIIKWKGRSDASIRVCASCMDHNVRRRGGMILGPYPPKAT